MHASDWESYLPASDSGQDLVNLAIYRMLRPKAYIDEARAYVHNQNPANAPYSQSQIIRVELRLGLIRKAK